MAFSEAYVQAVASAAGFVYEPDRLDLSSIDGTVKARRAIERFDLQLKCTSQRVLRNDHISFRLGVEHYDELRDPETSRPLILVVVLAPPRLGDWVAQDEDQLLMRHCAYWTWLQGRPASTNAQWVTVQIPRSAQLTVAEMQRMMSCVSRNVPITGEAE